MHKKVVSLFRSIKVQYVYVYVYIYIYSCVYDKYIRYTFIHTCTRMMEKRIFSLLLLLKEKIEKITENYNIINRHETKSDSYIYV